MSVRFCSISFGYIILIGKAMSTIHLYLAKFFAGFEEIV